MLKEIKQIIKNKLFFNKKYIKAINKTRLMKNNLHSPVHGDNKPVALMLYVTVVLRCLLYYCIFCFHS